MNWIENLLWLVHCLSSLKYDIRQTVELPCTALHMSVYSLAHCT